MSNRVSLSPPQTARRQSQPIFTPPNHQAEHERHVFVVGEMYVPIIKHILRLNQPIHSPEMISY